MSIAIAGLVERRQALASLLPIRHRRVAVARLQLLHRQAELRQAEASLQTRQQQLAAASAAVDSRRAELAGQIAGGTEARQIQPVLAQIDWLEADRRSAEQQRARARDARDKAGRQLDLARQGLQILEERSRQLEKLAGRARRLVERRLAERNDARFVDRYAAEQHAASRRQATSAQS